jgi:hypothetical protein
MSLLSDGGITANASITAMSFSSDNSKIFVAVYDATSDGLTAYSFESEVLTQVDLLTLSAKALLQYGRIASPSSDDTYIIASESSSPYIVPLKLGDILPDYSSADVSGLSTAYIKTGE